MIEGVVPARQGVAVRLSSGQSIKLINTHGAQVVDFWAFNAADLREFLSMEHLHTRLLRLIPRVGDPLVTNRRRPILTFMEDTTPGIHDTVIAACDIHRYMELGCTTYHENCTDNLGNAMRGIGLAAPECPAPFNVFMNVPVNGEGMGLAFVAPTSKPGDYVVFRAEMDCIVAMSACPMDITPVNGDGLAPTEVHYAIY